MTAGAASYDFIVIGGGLAGSTAAILLAELGSVALISKAPPEETNSYQAQGGIAATWHKDDHAQLHLSDTLTAGAGLCHVEAVEPLVNHASRYTRWLEQIGVLFDRTAAGEYALGLEGAHCRPRIWHAGGDATGAAAMNAVTQRLRDLGIRRWDGYQAVALCTHPFGNVCGADIAPVRRHGEQIAALRLTARYGVILATGGVAHLFAHTTNPAGATGDGIALAWRAGAQLRNLEFVQFHPTALVSAVKPHPLISEAVRGAGARLSDQFGRFIMADHPQVDLAPRDVVARRIYALQQADVQVYLDARPIDRFAERFPTVLANCLAHGIDPVAEPIPVTPAAHFHMGGVAASLRGETSVPGLYAIGETACTGVHGANRLASNSLLEAVGMAHELALHMKARLETTAGLDQTAPARDTDICATRAFTQDDEALLATLQNVLWQTCGIVRDASELSRGLQEVERLRSQNPDSPAVLVAQLMLQSALYRKESRGGHYRSDFPAQDPLQDDSDTVLTSDMKTGGVHVAITTTSTNTDRFAPGIL